MGMFHYRAIFATPRRLINSITQRGGFDSSSLIYYFTQKSRCMEENSVNIERNMHLHTFFF